MPQHGRERNRNDLMLCDFIRMAYTAGNYFDKYFILLRPAEIELINDKGSSFFINNGCSNFHMVPPVLFSVPVCKRPLARQLLTGP